MTDTHMIVVGVDGSDGGRRALQWAAREAAARGGTVTAVTAWRWDQPAGGLAGPDRDGDAEAQAAEMLAREIAALPVGATVTGQVREGRPADVLGAAAREADLLVLGSHGHSKVWHTVLGSVTEECVRTATCPVVVIPVPHDDVHRPAPPAVR